MTDCLANLYKFLALLYSLFSDYSLLEMTSGLVHAFDDICDALEPLSIGAENEFLRFLTDQSVVNLMSESKDKELGKLKKVLSQEKTKTEKLEITLKHVRARLDEQFWLREQAELKMKQMQEEVGRVSSVLTRLFIRYLVPYSSIGCEISSARM